MIHNLTKTVNFFYFLVFLILAHQANFYLITHFDGTGYGVTVLSAIAILMFVRSHKLYTFKPPVIAWAILMFYHLLNCYFRGIMNPEYSIFTITVRNLALLVCLPFLYTLNPKKTIYVVLVAFLYNLVATYLTGSTGEYDGRLTGIYYTTQLGQMAGLACCLTSVLIEMQKKKWYYFLYIVPIGIMLLAGSRNGLLVVAFALVMLLTKYISKGNIMQMMFFIAALFFGYNYLQTTEIYDRLITVSSEFDTLQTGTIWDKILGDRIYYYVVGFQNFLDNPSFGIGLLNFQDYNRYRYPLHTEPITHLAEGGIIGFALYLIFLGCYISKFAKYCTFKSVRLNQMLVMFICIFVVGLTARIFHYEFFFAIYGIIGGEILLKKQNIIIKK